MHSIHSLGAKGTDNALLQNPTAIYIYMTSYACGHVVDEERGVGPSLTHIGKRESWRAGRDGHGVRVAHEVTGGRDGGQSQTPKL